MSCRWSITARRLLQNLRPRHWMLRHNWARLTACVFTPMCILFRRCISGDATTTRASPPRPRRFSDVFSNHHNSFAAGKWYAYADRNSVSQNSGIGSTDEYFLHTYQVPSWTLEIEPSGGQDFHAPLPGAGPIMVVWVKTVMTDSSFRNRRSPGCGKNWPRPLPQSITARQDHRQSTALRMLDSETGAVVLEAEWDTVNSQTRSLYSKQLRPLQLNHSYHAWMSFNKPMRWRVDGEVAPFPGQPASTLDLDADLLVGESPLTVTLEAGDWLNQPGEAPDGFMTLPG